MLALNSDSTHPLASHPHTHSHTSHISYSQESEIRDKTQLFQLQIRNNQIRDLKQRCRDRLLRVNLLQGLLGDLPVSGGQSVDWCLQFMRMYNEGESLALSADQIISIFWLVEKHINRYTLQLLEVVVIRAPSNSLDLLFQYDVMKLLHTVIVCTDLLPTRQTLNKSCSSQQSESIIKQAVVSTNSLSRVSVSLSQVSLGSQDQNREQQMLEMVRTAVSIIGQLCKKSVYIRNFAVINHKTYTYCLKAYKKHGVAVQKEFFRFLAAATAIDFQRNEEQFNRISAKILTTIFTSSWKLQPPSNLQTEQHQDMVYCMRMLLTAAKNLVNMKQTWTLHKVELTESKYHRTLFEIGAGVVSEMSGMMGREEIGCGLVEVLEAAIQLCLHYYDYLQLTSKLNHTIEHSHSPKHQMSLLYPPLIAILQHSASLPRFENPRRMIYFLLNNQIIDTDISQSLRHSLLDLNYNGLQLDLMTILAELLPLETVPLCLYELAYLLHSIFLSLPLAVLSPLLFHSQIVQGICERTVQSVGVQNHEVIGKALLVKGLVMLLERSKCEDKRLGEGVGSIVGQQFGSRLRRMLDLGIFNGMLYQQVDRLLMGLQGEWLQG